MKFPFKFQKFFAILLGVGEWLASSRGSSWYNNVQLHQRHVRGGEKGHTTAHIFHHHEDICRRGNHLVELEKIIDK